MPTFEQEIEVLQCDEYTESMRLDWEEQQRVLDFERCLESELLSSEDNNLEDDFILPF